MCRTYSIRSNYNPLYPSQCKNHFWVDNMDMTNAPLAVMILWPPAASFSSASTWPSAVSRTSTHEFESDSERSSLVFGESATTISYQNCNEVFKDEGVVIWWMAGWDFQGLSVRTTLRLFFRWHHLLTPNTYYPSEPFKLAVGHDVICIYILKNNKTYIWRVNNR